MTKYNVKIEKRGGGGEQEDIELDASDLDDVRRQVRGQGDYVVIDAHPADEGTNEDRETDGSDDTPFHPEPAGAGTPGTPAGEGIQQGPASPPADAQPVSDSRTDATEGHSPFEHR